MEITPEYAEWIREGEDAEHRIVEESAGRHELVRRFLLERFWRRRARRPFSGERYQ